LGDWAKPPIPNPQSPIPNFSLYLIFIIILTINKFILNKIIIIF